MASGDKAEGAKAGEGFSIIGLLIVSIIAIGAGALLPFVLPRPAMPDSKAVSSPAAAKEADNDVVIPLDPIVTNLAEPASTWVRLEASLIIQGGAKIKKSELSRNVGEDLIAFLRTLRLAQIATPSGYQHLYDDLNDRVRLRAEGSNVRLIITGFVLE